MPVAPRDSSRRMRRLDTSGWAAASAMTAPAQESISSKQVAAYLTPKEVADMLRVSEKSIYRWAKDDPSMPMLRLGGTVRFPRERLERWLRDREQGRPLMRRPGPSESRPPGDR